MREVVKLLDTIALDSVSLVDTMAMAEHLSAVECRYAVHIKHESCASSGCTEAQLYALECVISTQCKEQNGLPHLVTRSFLPRRDT